LQYRVFPNGTGYNKKIRAVLTPKLNSVFNCVTAAARVVKENKKGYLEKNSLNSHLVALTGLSSKNLEDDLIPLFTY